MSQLSQSSAANKASEQDEAREEDERQYACCRAEIDATWALSAPHSTQGPDCAPARQEDVFRRIFPNRPRNHAKTLAFSDLFTTLFNPLNENKKTKTNAVGARSGFRLSPHEQRRHVIDKFIRRWRRDVGDDFYPAMRLILPDKDRDRGMYGLKESTIGKLLVKVMKIDKNSHDGYGLLHWRLPGQTMAGRMAGDFAGRCFEVLSTRQLRSEPGRLTVADVNELLDQMAAGSDEAENLAIFGLLYNQMNAEEMVWMIRIVLRQLRIGTTERTLLHVWHPDAEALFNVSSSLRRVCWELYDPAVRLQGDEVGIGLMQCFQPQLAQFQIAASFEKMVQRLGVSEADPEFWIEEKLDGERMQMHLVEDPSIPGQRRFGFWSRKGKEYSYLYGTGFEDLQSSLTRYLAAAFEPRVRNIILDGEMITWDPDNKLIMPFGTLKTAALAEARGHVAPGSPDGRGGGGGGGGERGGGGGGERGGSGGSGDGDSSGGVASTGARTRPVFRVFDIMFLNDKSLTQYTLRDRRRALEHAVPGVAERLEIHPYQSTSSTSEIEPRLREVVARSCEGLVLKNPRSMYRLNSRNDDWLKVKPDYMTEFGESIDCVIIGGYYGSGRRGGTLSSFLCGLRASANHVQAGAHPEKCFSFCKVGGGFRAEDYAEVKHRTEGKWHVWNARQPPTDYIALAGGPRQYERPDAWIRPSESVVVEVKAASISVSDQFALGKTLRFPRFRRLRLDKAWDGGLDVDDLKQLENRVGDVEKEKAMKMERRRQGRSAKRACRERVIVGVDQDAVGLTSTPSIPQTGLDGEGADRPALLLFAGLRFCVLSEAVQPPVRKTKAQLEALIRDCGGTVCQRADDDDSSSGSTILLGDKRVVKVASLIKGGKVNIIRPAWLLDCVSQPPAGFILPYEPCDIFDASSEGFAAAAAASIDRYGDSFARDVPDASSLSALFDAMPRPDGSLAQHDTTAAFEGEEPDGNDDDGDDDFGSTRGRLFARCTIRFVAGVEDAVRLCRLRNYVLFGDGKVVEGEGASHVVVVSGAHDAGRLAQESEAGRAADRTGLRPVARVVVGSWVETCWQERTLVDEEDFGC